MNAFEQLIDTAQRIQDALAEDANQYSLALEAVEIARKARDTAKEVYAEQESSWLFDLTFGDDDYTKAKNAEAREVVKDAKLIKARTSGPLFQAWRILANAQVNLDNAEMALAQADTRFKAVRVAAELQSSMMRCAASAAESVRM